MTEMEKEKVMELLDVAFFWKCTAFFLLGGWVVQIGLIVVYVFGSK